MVNKALEGMIVAAHGGAAWDRIKQRAGVDIDVFVSNEGYDDALTYGLVGAAAEELAQPPADLLVAFGRHWVLHTAREGYGDLLQAGGSTLPEFLHNLPAFHTRVALVLPHLRPPVFRCTNETPRSVCMHYESERPGLTAFVRGLLLGLGERFETPVTVTLLAGKAAGAPRDVFRVEWSEPAR
jgi:hypothetical protein